MARVPIYQVIHDDLLRQIASGDLAPASRLQSEGQLAKSYGVSRMTVRQALDRLVADGLILRQQGTGTFVNSSVHGGRHLNRLGSLADELQEDPDSVSSVIVTLESAPVPEAIARRLKVSEGQLATRLQRVRLVKGTPAVFQDTWVPFAIAPDLTSEGLVGESLYRTLHERYGVELKWADQTMTAVIAPEWVAHLLGVSTETAVLAGERISHTASNQAVEITHSWTLPRFPLRLRIDA